MSITNGHTPLPNNFIADLNSLELTHREYRLMMTIGTEIYRFPEGRKTLSKELATRYLEKLTKIRQNHISRMLNKFHSRGYIKYIKSHIKGQGSIIILTLDTAAGSDNSDTITVSETMNLDTTTASNLIKSDTATDSNQINQKKDHEESDLTDSTTDTNKEKQKIKETTTNFPFDFNNSIRNTSYKESNSNNLSINLLSPAGPGAYSNEFTSMGNILSGYIPVSSQPSARNASESSEARLSPVVIEEGKKLLLSRGFNKEQVQSISRRIIESIKKHTPEKPDAYFLTSVKNEKIKALPYLQPAITDEKHSVYSHSNVSSSTAVTKSEPVNQVAIKEAPSAGELLTEIQAIAPDELYEIIMSVDSDKKVQKSLSFFSSDIVREEILASHYVSAFKKKYPGRLNI